MPASSVDAPKTAPAPPANYTARPFRAQGRSTPRGSPRRILYIEANTDGTVGGSHRALFDLVTHLDRTRFEPVIVFYQDNVYVDRLRKRGIEVHLYDEVHRREKDAFRMGGALARARGIVAAVLHRRRFLRSEGISLVHLNNSPRVGNDDWLPATRLLRIPCIANVMGDASGATGRLRRVLFRSFDHYLPISAYITAAMERLGIPPERMDLVHLGVDLESFRARVRRSAAVVRDELGVEPGRLLALMVGNVREWKGQHVALEALRLMAPGPRSALHIAFAGASTEGDREYLSSLRAQVRTAGLDGQVSFLGGRDDVPDLLSAADIALHASIRPEPFGLVVVEAMALGKPMVAANTGGPGEVVSPGSGATFDPSRPEELASILTALVENPAYRATLGEGALERVKEFTINRYVAGVERAYEKILSRRR